jgi:hypothetical protein
MSPTRDVVLFDPLETLGSETASSRAGRFEAFLVYPSARGLLEGLRERARLGVFSPDPAVPVDRLRELLRAGGLIPPIDPEFVRAADRGGENPFARLSAEPGLERLVFVSLDAAQRTRALAAGLRVAPHLALVAAVLDGQSLHFARLSLPDSEPSPEWAALLNGLAAVPVLRIRAPEPVLYVITSRHALEALTSGAATQAIRVEALGPPDLVARTTLLLLQVTREQVDADVGLQTFGARLRATLPLVHETAGGWLVALPGDRSIEELHPPPAGAGHGHVRVLLPDLSVLKPPAVRAPLRVRDLSESERSVLGGIRAGARRGLERWFGPASPREGEER